MGHPIIGSTISHYNILAKLGQGGMGIVYKAQDSRLGRLVAVKFIGEDWSDEGDSLRRFAQEARAASALNHPHICTIHDIDEYEGKPFIVMELLEGVTLERCLAEGGLGFTGLFASGTPMDPWLDSEPIRRDHVPTGALTIEDIFEIGIQISGALEAAHAAGIIHRDVKPGNIFLTRAMQAKLLDFGLAKLVGRQQGGTTAMSLSAGLWRSGLRVGTIPYMSPEQLDGDTVDHRTDLFSLGTVLYEMTARRHPFLGQSASSTIANVLKEEPRSLKEFCDVPDGLESVVRRCLRKAPLDRYPSASEILVNLKEAKEEHASHAVKRGGERSGPGTGREVEIPMSRPVARALFLLTQAGYLAMYISALFYLEDVERVLANSYSAPPDAVWGVAVLALCGIAVRIYLVSSVSLDHPEIGTKFHRLFPVLLVLDALWTAAPLLLVAKLGVGTALAGVAGLAYVPFAQRTLMGVIRPRER